jgi:hypothetical protein
MIHLHSGNEWGVTARSCLQLSALTAPMALIAWLSVLAPVALSACARSDSEPAPSSVDTNGKSDASAAHGGSAVSSGQQSDVAGRNGSAGRSSAGTSASGAQAAAGAAGDGGGADDASQASAPSGDVIQDIAAGLARAMCSALRDCVGPSGLRSLVGRESCEQRFSATYAQSGFALLAESVARQRIVVHKELLEQCFKDTAALGCNVQRERPPSSCSRAIEGRVALGDTCSSGWDCTGATFCSEGACPRSCVARVAAGTACDSDNDCTSGLLCAAEKCVAPGLAGDSCGGKSAVPCILGAACVDSTEDTAGTCRANSEILVAELGAACDLNTVYCREGLSCGFDGAALSCQNPVSSGEMCHLAAPAQCPKDEFCNATRIDQAGHCQMMPVAGEACVLDGECAAGYVCVAEAGKPVCRPLRNLAEACNQSGECRSGRCADAHCAAGIVCE